MQGSQARICVSILILNEPVLHFSLFFHSDGLIERKEYTVVSSNKVLERCIILFGDGDSTFRLAATQIHPSGYIHIYIYIYICISIFSSIMIQ